MTMKFSAGDALPIDTISAAEQHLKTAGEALARTIALIEAGVFGDAETTIDAVRDLSCAILATIEERVCVEKLRKHVTGTIGTGALDLHAARDEIGRRLACLRDAEPG